MVPYIFGYLDADSIAKTGARSLREHFRKTLFSSLPRDYSNAKLARIIKVSEIEVQDYMTGRLNLTEKQLSRLAWLSGKKLEDIIPLRDLRVEDMEHWKERSSRGVTSLGGALVEELANKCGVQIQEKPCWDYNPSDNFSIESHSEPFCQELSKGDESRLIVGFISFQILAYMDNNPQFDFKI
jgi:hypothetical protein